MTRYQAWYCRGMWAVDYLPDAWMKGSERTMAKRPELISADEIHEQNMRDLDNRREHDRTRIANDVAIKVIRYRADHGLSQAALARMLGMRQPNVARLESGDHEPTLSTLAKLSEVLGLDLSVDIKPGHVQLRAG